MAHIGDQIEPGEILATAVFATNIFKIVDGVIGGRPRIAGAVIPNYFSTLVDKTINVGGCSNHWVIGL